jgi:hypothetical protein
MSEEVKIGLVSLESFCRGLLGTHQVWARKYAVQQSEKAGDMVPCFFVVAVPKGTIIGHGLVRSLAGDVVASLMEASRGE